MNGKEGDLTFASFCQRPLTSGKSRVPGTVERGKRGSGKCASAEARQEGVKRRMINP
jgi:hypothetical protein